MKSPVRLGVVGCGEVAARVHLPVLSRLPEVEVVALADRDGHRLGRVADSFGVTSRHAHADALIADPAVEAVAVCLPPREHAPAALATLEAGKHLLVEKPLVLSLDEADRLVERAAASPVVAMVGFNLRWLDSVRRARDLVDRGELGEVELMRTALTGNRRFDPDAPDWRRRPALGGGSLIEQGIHHFDLWRFLLGAEVDRVFADAHPEDAGAAVTARMTGGALTQTTLSERTTPTHSVEIMGTEACVQLRLTHFDGFRLLPAGREDSAPAARARAALATVRGLPRGMAELRRGGRFASSYAQQWRAFARAVRTGERPAPTFEDGRRALEISLAARASASISEPVEPGDAADLLAST